MNDCDIVDRFEKLWPGWVKNNPTANLEDGVYVVSLAYELHALRIRHRIRVGLRCGLTEILTVIDPNQPTTIERLLIYRVVPTSGIAIDLPPVHRLLREIKGDQAQQRRVFIIGRVLTVCQAQFAADFPDSQAFRSRIKHWCEDYPTSAGLNLLSGNYGQGRNH